MCLANGFERFCRFRTNRRLQILQVIICLLLANACSSIPVPTNSAGVASLPVQTDLVSITPSITPGYTALATLTPTQTSSPEKVSPSPVSASPTVTSSQTPTPSETPSPLPLFSSSAIRPGIEPSAYITDTCQYLEARWSSASSPPGTVVIPIMFHGIRESGGLINDNATISEDDFLMFVQYARQLGFETITSDQLVVFLYHNARIPARSMLMIVDDRRPGTVETHFLPVLVEYGWTVTLGWINAGSDEALWTRMEEMNRTGRLDIQSHGYQHRYIVETMPEEEIREEIFDPVRIIEQHFGKKPLAMIWPGGNFTSFSVKLAREAGYLLGFTANSRGPVMYNWIPLGEKEREVQDPLMVLPRGWSTALGVNLDVAVRIGDQARENAVEHYPEEAAYYHTYCGGELPPLDSIFPNSLIP